MQLPTPESPGVKIMDGVGFPSCSACRPANTEKFLSGSFLGQSHGSQSKKGRSKAEVEVGFFEEGAASHLFTC